MTTFEMVGDDDDSVCVDGVCALPVPREQAQATIASTNVLASNGARSSGPSPSPTSLTGTPSSR